jgi:hypothetical protein
VGRWRGEECVGIDARVRWWEGESDIGIKLDFDIWNVFTGRGERWRRGWFRECLDDIFIGG